MSTANQGLYLNAAGYLFTPLAASSLETLRVQVRDRARTLGLRGTVTLTAQGLNSGVAGSVENVRKFTSVLPEILGTSPIPYKESFSDAIPFDRMLVKVKPRLLPVELDWDASVSSTTQLPATTLRDWLAEGRDLLLVDTRNDYEYELGSFEGAIPLPITSFRKFETEARMRYPEWKDKTIVTFCTGGIRCEMAVPLMVKKLGYEHVFQLQGGILQYFDDVGGDHWRGDCFVFDKRVSVDPKLKPTDHHRCRTAHATEADAAKCVYCAFANGYKKHVLPG